MKQTAIEWLQEQLSKILIDNQIQQTKHLFEQAKEMGKQQIIDAYETGDKYKLEVPGEQYYKETFNK
jgi:hypothetical protein